MSFREFVAILTVACLLALMLLSGCATLPPETRAEEATYQVLAAVDATQTLRIADTPTLRETNPLLGNKPSPEKVAAAFAVGGVLHYAVTYELVQHDAPAWLVRTWELAGIGVELACVGNNVGDGIRPTLSFHVNVGPAPAPHPARIR